MNVCNIANIDINVVNRVIVDVSIELKTFDIFNCKIF